MGKREGQVLGCVSIGIAVAGLVLALGTDAQAVIIETVAVGDPGNAADDTGYGAVADEYRIGTYEVTNSQYADFLNAVASSSDPYGLYSLSMGNGYGGITRTGSLGNYTYNAISGRENKPVNYVSFWDACRFANWMHNGQGSGDTETGAYTLTTQGMANNTVTRNAGALVFIPTVNEWYKAAYYKGGGTNAGYWDYPTQSDTAPTAEAPPGADFTNGSANYNNAVGGGSLTDAGAYSAKPSDSAYGTFDQAGNVFEWNETIVATTSRGVRGGSFGSAASVLHSSYNISVSPTTEYNVIGFRVGRVPDPATITLLALGSLPVLLLHRRRRA